MVNEELQLNEEQIAEAEETPNPEEQAEAEEQETAAEEQETEAEETPKRKVASEILTGRELNDFIDPVRRWPKRNGLWNLDNYIANPKESKIFILYGFRLTGKTTLMKQALIDIRPDERKKAAYISVKPGVHMADLENDLLLLQVSGTKYVFIDEITNAEDFVSNCSSILLDFLGMGLKIVLCGGDSLEFLLASKHELNEKCIFEHLNYISYKEFNSLFGRTNLETYLRKGGLAVYGDKRNFLGSEKQIDDYLRYALAENIEISLESAGNEAVYGALWNLHDEGKLEGAILKMVKDECAEYAFKIFAHEFKLGDIGAILDTIKNSYGEEIPKDAHESLKDYFDLLDFTASICSAKASLPKAFDSLPIYLIPAIRYSQCMGIFKKLICDILFAGESREKQQAALLKLESALLNSMFKDQLLLEIRKAFDRNNASSEVEISRLEFDDGDNIDLVVSWRKEGFCQIYNISTSREAGGPVAYSIQDIEKLKKAESFFGRIIGRSVIYFGDNCTVADVRYINAIDFLLK